MNNLQKVQIEKYRHAGMGFVDIAQKLGIPVSTIKSYCYRHSIADITAQTRGAFCPQCGLPVPEMKYKPRRFCSDACRVRFWHQHSDEMKRNTRSKCLCARCGKAFLDYAGRHRKYCSHSCYIAARYGGERRE